MSTKVLLLESKSLHWNGRTKLTEKNTSCEGFIGQLKALQSTQLSTVLYTVQLRINAVF